MQVIKVKADLNLIIWLLENHTVYSISKGTGIPQTTLNPYLRGERKFENMTLGHASKLTDYALKLKEDADDQ